MTPAIEVLQPVSLADYRAASASPAVAATQTLVQREPLVCADPLGLDADAATFFFGADPASFSRKYPFPPRTRAVLPGARLVGPGWVVVTGDRYVVTDSYSGPAALEAGGHFRAAALPLDLDGTRHRLPLVLHRRFAPTQTMSEPCVLIGTYWHFNYHHWLVDCLPRLRGALEDPALAEARIVVPASGPAFQQATLEHLGVPPERLLRFDGTAWQFEQLYVPSTGCFAPDELRWLRQRMRGKVSVAQASRQRLYLSRAKAASRRIVNEDELLPVLHKHGFAVIQAEGLPWQEQLALFAGASVIAGPHGAGLTNLLFAADGATLLEIAPHDQVNHCFWLMANAVGHRYALLCAQTQNADRDMYLAPAQLDQQLTTLFS